MSFFDSKEEIIKIELTSVGKTMLAKGKFNPKYYAFYDDDILYDSRYANFSESQNDTQDRILKNTAYSKPQTNYESIQKKSNQETIKKGINNFLLPYSLGTSDPNSIYAPAWQIKAISGKIENIITGTSTQEEPTEQETIFINIPKITLGQTTVKFVTEDAEDTSLFFQRENTEKSVYLKYENKKNVLLIEEKNTIDDKEKFSIEVFTRTTNSEEWQKLKFYRSPLEIQDNLLLEKPLYDIPQEEYDSDTVEYYLDILIDDEAARRAGIKQAIVYKYPIGDPDKDMC